jgi:hypothetical protein
MSAPDPMDVNCSRTSSNRPPGATPRTVVRGPMSTPATASAATMPSADTDRTVVR